MKKTKKNNKGFSLVELIVVVLIMAIIAVALAPQVMKWVGQSRVSKDINVYEQVYSNLQTAVADEKVWNEIKTSTITITVNKASAITGWPTPASGTKSELEKKFEEISGDVSLLQFQTVSSANITITNGSVKKTTTINPEDGSTTP